MSTRAVIEETIGQSIDTLDWRRRMKEGVIVTLTVKRWRARKKLTLQELGIYPPTFEARQAYETLLSLGSKSLLPVKLQQELDAIERGARMFLADNAIKTPFGLFLPYTKYKMWADGNEDYKQRYLAKRDEIVAAYEEIRAELLSEYDHVAKHTYSLLMSQVPDLMGDYGSEDYFVAHFREDMIARNMKTASDFAATFVYEELFTRVPLLNSLDTEETSASEVEKTISVREEEKRAANERRLMLEQMNRDLVAKTRVQKEALIDNFLGSLVGQLRGMTYEAVSSVLASIKEQETLQGRPVLQLKKLIEQLRDLNFYGDADIDRILTLLHSMIVKDAKDRNIPEITQQLRAIANLTRGTILALGETPREGRDISPLAIGVLSAPSNDEIREARAEIEAAIRLAQFPDHTDREEREERAAAPLLTQATLREERTE